jgi:Trypsin-like peptidase domain/Effector-associated domain 1
MWEQFMEDLLDLLVSLYPDTNSARDVADRAGLPTRFIRFGGNIVNIWMSIIREARKVTRIEEVIEVARKDYPSVSFPILERSKDETIARGPNIKDIGWRGIPDGEAGLEKIMGAQPTFLPISFLEIGLLKAQSVVRIVCPNGLGSGFITPDNLLITNHHVIPDPDLAKKTLIQFNYQLTAAGLAAQPEEYELVPEDGFATSPMKGGDDWTAVRIKTSPSAKWRGIELAEASVKPNDYVNIIQHPSGLPKQIAIYHNVVTYGDNSRVQYLTDTLPGSSGSPVFNSQWQVVALHHSGGWLTEPGTKQVLFRNEGIAIGALMRGLREHGLLA